MSSQHGGQLQSRSATAIGSRSGHERLTRRMGPRTFVDRSHGHRYRPEGPKEASVSESDVPEADALEQAQSVVVPAEAAPLDLDVPEPTSDEEVALEPPALAERPLDPEVAEADALDQARPVRLDEDERVRLEEDT